MERMTKDATMSRIERVRGCNRKGRRSLPKANWRSRTGGVLIAVAMFFALVGILFGLGRLKAYELRVQRRLERQYEIDKMVATRSALSLNQWNSSLNKDNEPLGCTNIFRSGLDQDLEVRVTPVPPLIGEDMANTNVITEERWTRVDSPTDGTRVLLNQPVGNQRVAHFSCVNTTGTVSKSCAIFRKLPVNWLETQFGLIYRMDPDVATTSNGFNRLRFYLVGMDDVDLSKENMDYSLTHKQSFMLETQATRSVTNGEEVVSEFAIRDFYLNNMPTPGPPIRLSDCIGVKGKSSDQIMHATGFLLSGLNAVAFGENPLGGKLFSGALNLKGLVDTNAFTNAWVVIQHVFPTNFPSAPPPFVTVASFQVQEPMTFSISVFNRSLGANYVPAVSTWEFLTRYPQDQGDKDDKGAFCLIDTFGSEASSLRRERRGKGAEE